MTTTNQSESVPNVEWKTPEKQTTVAIVGSPLGQEVTTTMSDDSDQSFLQDVAEDIADEDEEVNPDKEDTIKGLLLGVGMATFFGGILGLLVNPSEPISGFVGGALLFGILSAVVVGAMVSEGGDFNLQQQQQSSSSSEPKVVCSCRVSST